MDTLPTGLVIEGEKVLYKKKKFLITEYNKLFNLLEKRKTTF